MDSKGKILVIGSSNTDMTVKVHNLPTPGETVSGNSFVMGPGGKGANQAVAAKRLGGNVTFVCKVGKDIFGDNAIAQYEAEGLDTRYILRSDKASGVALIPVDDKGENSIVVAGGANNDFTVEDINNIKDVILESDIVLLQLEIPVASVLEAAKIAHEAGKTVVLNPAPAADLPEEIFKYVSLFIPNETEMSTFSAVKVTDETSAIKAADIMREKGVKDMIVTMGKKGSMILKEGEEARIVNALKVNAVDTTGAGDTYCGAICEALSEGKSLHEAALFATKASALKVCKAGAQKSIPHRKEVDELQ